MQLFTYSHIWSCNDNLLPGTDPTWKHGVGLFKTRLIFETRLVFQTCGSTWGHLLGSTGF